MSGFITVRGIPGRNIAGSRGRASPFSFVRAQQDQGGKGIAPESTGKQDRVEFVTLLDNQNTKKPPLWNAEPFTKTAVSQTNNPLERFNRGMNSSFPAPHPNLPDSVVVGIEKLARRYANLKYEIEIGRALAPQRLPIILPKPVALPETSSSSDSDSVSDYEDSPEEDISNVLRADGRNFVPSRMEGPVSVPVIDFGQIQEEDGYYETVC
ncbi:hypothetical protein PC114_g4880 [Phytophthora cactorum]|nr:hypothetical protein PC114_g4880 [Phytophthora cactorum]